MADLTPILRDLADESQVVDDLVAGLPDSGWARPTPAPGWTIAHQIAHLAWTDAKSLLAVRDPEAFQAELASVLAEAATFVDKGAEEGAADPPPVLLTRWREGRAALADALAGVPEGYKIPWYGPPMSAASMASARMMETWAHGQDVADTFSVVREPTARLWHIARLGVRTRDFAYAVNQRTPPAEEFRVELTAPDGAVWDWGPPDAAQRVTGSALDFCLLVTQRRHRDDTDVVAVGEQAAEWLTIAQAFAGPPGGGREPGGQA
ncbi:TIGR03084 family metal-binding protein [Amycolatopsis suaedae]|uniref:TIGR03084 family protein n=1 Tax=Amycolatopsis suaedae TaxID=2510978 RepID=A0A4Q7JE51_9PSEU|nr:TIGR03084 family metal-binding protein [Amycolatopsis suaedae]RZQ65727.1 TIGR03084 family protein [Amycolatopsis suaedae]